jgi:hypothetical protein
MRTAAVSQSTNAGQRIASNLGRPLHHLSLGGHSAAQPVPPKGFAFAIGDLVLARSWAASRDLRMMFRLDYGDKTEEYEEVIEFRRGRSAASSLIIWRSAEVVFVQPIPGRRKQHGSVAEALETVHPKPAVRLADITANVGAAR